MTTQAKPDDKAITKKTASVVDLVQARIDTLAKAGRLAFPADYHAGNALLAAFLKIKGTLDKDKRPALEVCTTESVQLALLDMVVQGLTPSKDQCYFVVHGNKLTLMTSYHGKAAVCIRVTNAEDIWAYAVYQKDDFEYEIQGKRVKITKHVQKLSNVKADEIVAAYAVIDVGENKPPVCEVMTMDQIKQAWRMNRFYKPDDPDDVHNRFPDMMARKTVMGRLAKQYVNRSSDNTLLLAAFNRADEETDEVAAEAAIDEGMSQGASVEILPPGEIQPDAKTAEEAAPQPETKDPILEMRTNPIAKESGKRATQKRAPFI